MIDFGAPAETVTTPPIPAATPPVPLREATPNAPPLKEIVTKSSNKELSQESCDIKNQESCNVNLDSTQELSGTTDEDSAKHSIIRPRPLGTGVCIGTNNNAINDNSLREGRMYRVWI